MRVCGHGLNLTRFFPGQSIQQLTRGSHDTLVCELHTVTKRLGAQKTSTHNKVHLKQKPFKTRAHKCVEPLFEHGAAAAAGMAPPTLLMPSIHAYNSSAGKKEGNPDLRHERPLCRHKEKKNERASDGVSLQIRAQRTNAWGTQHAHVYPEKGFEVRRQHLLARHSPTKEGTSGTGRRERLTTALPPSTVEWAFVITHALTLPAC